MRVESAARTGNETIAVRTTGAEFVFDLGAGAILCSQRIPVRREVVRITGKCLDGLRVREQNEARCLLGTGALDTAEVHDDSLLVLHADRAMTVVIEGRYEPVWIGEEVPHLLLPDETGGVGLYLIGSGTCEHAAAWKPGWKVEYRLAAGSRLLVSVFPPRPFDERQSKETMLHSFSWRYPYPTDAEIAEWRAIGSILTLHSWIWQGNRGAEMGVEKDESWGPSRYVAKSDTELHRVVATCHRHGMKVIPYMSPFYFGRPAGDVSKETMPDYLREVREALDTYGFDGVYFDGLYWDIEGSRELMRRVRNLVGTQGLLYAHSTSIPLQKIYCPFIDCHADYILRGEHCGLDAATARWYVSNYNLGNAVGTFCYDTTRPSAEMIDLFLSVNARLPYWVQEGTWNGIKYHLTLEEQRLFRERYFPRLATGEGAMSLCP